MYKGAFFPIRVMLRWFSISHYNRLILSFFVKYAEKVGDVSFSSDNNKRAVDVPSQSGNAPIARSSENASMESCDKRFDQQECTPPQTIPIHSSTQRGYTANSWPASINSKRNSVEHSASPVLFNDATRGDSSFICGGLLEDPNKHNRVLQVGREKDFIHIESINGRRTNVLQGLELHTQVFNANEQKEIVDCVYNLQRMGQRGQLRGMWSYTLFLILLDFVSLVLNQFLWTD